MMKKIILVPALVGVMGIGGALAVYGEQLIGSANNDQLLSTQVIEQKALAEVNGTIRDIDFEQDDSNRYYEVEVVTAEAEYDLTFNAVTGELLQKKKDTLDLNDTDDVQPSTATNTTLQNPTNSNTNVVKPATTEQTATTNQDNSDDTNSDDPATAVKTATTQTKAEAAKATAPKAPKTSMKEINDDRFDDDEGPGDDHNDKEKHNNKDKRNDDNDDNDNKDDDDNYQEKSDDNDD